MKIVIILSLVLLTSCFSKQSPNSVQQPQSKIKLSNIETDEKGMSLLEAVIKTKYGNITFKFYPKKAPATTKRIIQLIQEGFYNGLTFHRVIPGFVAQGGDPTGTGSGGSGQKIKAEFNDLQHIEGTIAMARAQDPNSADSQFYIALNRLPHLDGKYTIFGQVTKGLDLIHKIKQGDKIISITLIEP